jgi:hypothetical protein
MELIVTAHDEGGLTRLVERIDDPRVSVEQAADGSPARRDGGYVLRAIEGSGAYTAWAIGALNYPFSRVLSKRLI